jgi:hypothetical protein
LDGAGEMLQAPSNPIVDKRMIFLTGLFMTGPHLFYQQFILPIPVLLETFLRVVYAVMSFSPSIGGLE